MASVVMRSMSLNLLGRELDQAAAFDTMGAILDYDESSKTKRKYDLEKEIPI